MSRSIAVAFLGTFAALAPGQAPSPPADDRGSPIHLNTVTSITLPGSPDYRAQEGIATDGQDWYTSFGTAPNPFKNVTICRFDGAWNERVSQRLTLNYPGIPGTSADAHIGGLCASPGRLWAVVTDFDPTPAFPDLQTVHLVEIGTQPTLEYYNHYDLSASLAPLIDDGDIAGVAYHWKDSGTALEDRLYLIEYQDGDGLAPRLFEVSSNLSSATSVGRLNSRFANGIAFWGNYLFVTTGDAQTGSTNAIGEIHVYDFPLSSSGTNNPHTIYTYDCGLYDVPFVGNIAHAQDLVFRAGKLWVNTDGGRKVRLLSDPSPPDYVVWTGSGSGLGSTGNNWNMLSSPPAHFFNWDGLPTQDTAIDLLSQASGMCELSGSSFAEGAAIFCYPWPSSPLHDFVLRVNTTGTLSCSGLLAAGGNDLEVHNGTVHCSSWLELADGSTLRQYGGHIQCDGTLLVDYSGSLFQSAGLLNTDTLMVGTPDTTGDAVIGGEAHCATIAVIGASSLLILGTLTSDYCAIGADPGAGEVPPYLAVDSKAVFAVNYLVLGSESSRGAAFATGGTAMVSEDLVVASKSLIFVALNGTIAARSASVFGRVFLDDGELVTSATMSFHDSANIEWPIDNSVSNGRIRSTGGISFDGATVWPYFVEPYIPEVGAAFLLATADANISGLPVLGVERLPDGRRLSLVYSSIPTSPFEVSLVVTPFGDVDGDCTVDFYDLNAVLSNYSDIGMGLPGDVDADGDCDFADLNIVVSNWNVSC